MRAACSTSRPRTWSVIDPAPSATGAARAMYLPGKDNQVRLVSEPRLPDRRRRRATTWVIDMTKPSPTWRQVASMASPANAAPAHGASRRHSPGDRWLAELRRLRPVGRRASGRLALGPVHRDVAHALSRRRAAPLPLVRDPSFPTGGLLSAGGGHPPETCTRKEYRSEIFSPPYLFKGARPTITLGAHAGELRAELLRRNPGRLADTSRRSP